MSIGSKLPCVVVAIVGIAGCANNTVSGRVGSTLSGGGISMTLQRVDNHPAVPTDDITGLSTPRPGDRLVAARLRVCSTEGAAFGPYDFGIRLAGGGDGLVKFPATNYPDQFDPPSLGCASGWMVFEIPVASAPATIRFSFDDTGSNPGGGGRPEVHDRFSWAWS